MARTKTFKALVQKPVKLDTKFAEALLREGVDATLSGDVEIGKTVLRDYLRLHVSGMVGNGALRAPLPTLRRSG